MKKQVGLYSSQKGSGLVEYCLLVSLIAFMGIASINSFANALSIKFDCIGSSLSNGGSSAAAGGVSIDPCLNRAGSSAITSPGGLAGGGVSPGTGSTGPGRPGSGGTGSGGNGF